MAFLGIQLLAGSLNNFAGSLNNLTVVVTVTGSTIGASLLNGLSLWNLSLLNGLSGWLNEIHLNHVHSFFEKLSDLTSFTISHNKSTSTTMD